MRKRSAVQVEFGLRNFATQIAGSCSWKRLERNGKKLVKSKGRRAYRIVEGGIRSSCACPLANWESVMRGGNTNLQSGQANDASKNTGINSQSSCPDVSQDREPSGQLPAIARHHFVLNDDYVVTPSQRFSKVCASRDSTTSTPALSVKDESWTATT